MSKVYLITGAAGWLGCKIAETLCQNNIDQVKTMKLLDIKVSDNAKNMIEAAAKGKLMDIDWIVDDISNFKALNEAAVGVDVVIHTAAVVDYMGEVDDNLVRKVNVKGTENVINVCLKNNIQYCVYTSSSCVVGPNANGNPFIKGNEASSYPSKPNSTYEISKHEAERKILAANGRTLANGKKLCTCALRPCGMYGKDDPLLVQVYNLFSGSKMLISASKSNVATARMNVYNVAWSHVLAAQKMQELHTKVGGEAYFVGDDTPDLPYMRTNLIFLEDFGFTISKEPYLPYWVFYIIALLCSIFRAICSFFNYRVKIPLTPKTLVLGTTPFTFSHKKFADDFGYKPMFSWEESVAQTKEYMRNYIRQHS